MIEIQKNTFENLYDTILLSSNSDKNYIFNFFFKNLFSTSLKQYFQNAYYLICGMLGVDIDGEMIEIAKEYLKYDRGAFCDKRTELVIDDGVKFIKKEKEIYDVIIVDATDPSDNSQSLYTFDFYQKVFSRLNKCGIFTTYAGGGYYFHPEILKMIYKNMKDVFDIVKIYSFPIAGFLPGFSFIIGVKGNINIENIPEIKTKIDLKYYSPEIQPHLFSLPYYFEKELKNL